MLQVDEPDDYVLATNETHAVREFIERAFAFIGTTIEWQGAFGTVDEIGTTIRTIQPINTTCQFTLSTRRVNMHHQYPVLTHPINTPITAFSQHHLSTHPLHPPSQPPLNPHTPHTHNPPHPHNPPSHLTLSTPITTPSINPPSQPLLSTPPHPALSQPPLTSLPPSHNPLSPHPPFANRCRQGRSFSCASANRPQIFPPHGGGYPHRQPSQGQGMYARLCTTIYPKSIPICKKKNIKRHQSTPTDP